MSNILFSVFPNENFIDMSLYQFGWEQCQPSHSYGPAARNHYLFHYVISGTGTLMADDTSGITQTYSVKSGQGFMIFPQQITTYIADQKLVDAPPAKAGLARDGSDGSVPADQEPPMREPGED